MPIGSAWNQVVLDDEGRDPEIVRRNGRAPPAELKMELGIVVPASGGGRANIKGAGVAPFSFVLVVSVPLLRDAVRLVASRVGDAVGFVIVPLA